MSVKGGKCKAFCNSKHGILLSNARLLGALSPYDPLRCRQMNGGDILQERNKAVLIRLTEKEKNHLKKSADICGLKMEPFIRKLIMEKEIRPRPPDEYLRLIREINYIGNNINQIAHVANAENHISADKINEAVKMVDDIMDVVRGFESGNH